MAFQKTKMKEKENDQLYNFMAFNSKYLNYLPLYVCLCLWMSRGSHFYTGQNVGHSTFCNSKKGSITFNNTNFLWTSHKMMHLTHLWVGGGVVPYFL